MKTLLTTIQDPDDIEIEQTVFIEAIVRGKTRGNYLEVEIMDGICGLNVVTMRVHFAAAKALAAKQPHPTEGNV